jgi:hypothetical protein
MMNMMEPKNIQGIGHHSFHHDHVGQGALM